MKIILLLVVLSLLLVIPTTGLADPVRVVIDGSPFAIELVNLPARTLEGDDGRTVDVVGGLDNMSSNTGRAKGNAYRVDISVTLDEVDFWLNYTGAQTLTFYVFTSPVEFGTYTEIYRDTEVIDGVGPSWYSTGMISVPLTAGGYYIIAVSWDGYMTYYYNTGDSQATSFGAEVFGYATGFNPLPSSFSATVNDQAIYYQRLMTTMVSPVEESTWGKVKALYR
jgi:hypothetical protein